MRTRNLRHLVIWFILRSIYAEEADLCPVGTGMIFEKSYYKLIGDSSITRCSERCELDGTCLAWEFNIEASRCFLFKNVIHIATQYAFTGFKDCGNDYKCPVQAIINDNFLASLYPKNQWQDCAEACQMRVDCNSWIHLADANSCTLYTDSSFLTPCGNNFDPRCDLSKAKYEGTESINLGQTTLNLCSQECFQGDSDGGSKVTGIYHASNGTCFCLTDKNPVFDAGNYGDHVCLLIIEVNECENNPCHEFATCIDTVKSYQCICDKGYMGNGSHCEAMWLPNARCGPVQRLVNGMKAQCDHKGNIPCCSDHGYCGNTPEHCQCPACIDYRQECLYNDMEFPTESFREIAAVSSWRHCEYLCKQEEPCKAWEWKTETFDEILQHKVCVLKRDGNEETLRIRLGVMSGLKYCLDGNMGQKSGSTDEKRAFKGLTTQVTTCPYPGSCKGNMCTRGITGSVLEIGESLRSDNKKYSAMMQDDGNFVVYCNDRGDRKAIWSSRTSGTYVHEGLIFQTDGNLVLYSMFGQSKEALWSSGSFNKGADHLIMQDDGNLVMYGFYGRQIIWQSKSHGIC